MSPVYGTIVTTMCPAMLRKAIVTYTCLVLCGVCLITMTAIIIYYCYRRYLPKHRPLAEKTMQKEIVERTVDPFGKLVNEYLKTVGIPGPAPPVIITRTSPGCYIYKNKTTAVPEPNQLATTSEKEPNIYTIWRNA